MVNLSGVLRVQLKNKGIITSLFIDSILLKFNNNKSCITTRRHVNILVNYLQNNGFPIEQLKLKIRRQEEVLHSLISNVKQLLLKIKGFNKNLYPCCLFTYSCLLRPHQEIGLLKWEDFSDDLSYIKLGGNEVKSKCNRIVPVPSYIKEILVKGRQDYNMFSETA